MAAAERPKNENLCAEIHKGLNSGPAEPLEHHQRRSNQNLYAVNVACLGGISPFDFSEVPVMDGVSHTNDTGRPTRRAGTPLHPR